MELWKKNKIQFPRLISEIMATQELDLGDLAYSMDLSIKEIKQLFDRAEIEWNKIKETIQKRN